MDTYRGDKLNPKSLQLYTYTENDPINFIDPTGHKKLTLKMSLYTRLKKNHKKKFAKLTSSQKKLLKKVPSKYHHFNRNKYNTGLPKTEGEAFLSGWIIHPGAAAHQFNRQTKTQKVRGQKITRKLFNKKYFKGKKEIVFFNDGTVNNTAEDRGSYNFNKPHDLNDVVPWVAWGNSSTQYENIGSDSTSVSQRYKLVKSIFSKDAKKAYKAMKKIKLLGTVK